MNHYFYAPVPANLAENWKTPLSTDELKVCLFKVISKSVNTPPQMLGELIKTCNEQHVDFNYGVHLPATFEAAHLLQRECKTLASKFAALVKAGCSAFSVVFADGDAVNAPISEGGKNLGVLHAEGLNAVFAQVKSESGGKHLQFFVAPAHRHGDLQVERTLPKKHLYYWRDINTNLTHDAALLFNGPEQLNERISHHFAAALWSYWGAKRKVVLWDMYVARGVQVFFRFVLLTIA